MFMGKFCFKKLYEWFSKTLNFETCSPDFETLVNMRKSNNLNLQK